MDIGRTVFEHELPRRKLDAATFGTMGIGLAALTSARSCHPELWGVAVMGDSAFGFSGMECETLTRYKMGGVIFIINNNDLPACSCDSESVLYADDDTISVTAADPEILQSKLQVEANKST